MNVPFRACAVIALFTISMASSTQAAEPVIKIGGVGLNISDVERSKKFYTEVLTMKVAMTVPVGDKGSEVVLSLSGDLTSGQPFIVLAHLVGKPPGPGKEGFGRVIINTDDAAAIAKRATDGGYKVAKLDSAQMGNRVVYFISDPDGYQIEVFGASAAELKTGKL
jgi:catechol 2,3-dioxygenase-like lactoylglutathione lyase family enzyme